MVQSGSIIKLILRDEAYHGLFTGIVAQSVFKEIPDSDKDRVLKDIDDLAHKLFDNEVEYTIDLYAKIGLETEVIEFLKYNCNKAYENLGLKKLFGDVTINPIVENSLSTETTTTDMFSMKSDGYVKATNVESLSDDDFDWL